MESRTISRPIAIAIASLLMAAALAAPASAPAKAKRIKPISGKLSKPGYTVIALAKNGEARTTLAPKGGFRLRPPAGKVTLHLRAPDGTYAGPIVAGTRARGRRAIVGVAGGARLGRIAVKTVKGYARLAKRLPKRLKRSIDTKRVARARKGIPLGAGNFGLVLSAPPSKPPAGDLDFDGVPDPLDVDDDGDLVLDDYDRSTAAATSEVGNTFPDGSRLSIHTTLDEDFSHAANAGALSTHEQIVAAQAAKGELEIFWYGIDPGSGELDCGLLTYCTTGGTGKLSRGPNMFEPFPECCDLDGDGLGALTQSEGFKIASPDAGAMRLFPGVGGDQIGTGDVLILRGTVNGTPVESAKTIGFAFATAPVISSYDDGQGNATTFNLPLSADLPPAPMRAGPSGDIVLALSGWRPQRKRTAGDPGSDEWVDMGNLEYMMKVFVGDAGPPEGVGCPPSTISTTDANLTPTAGTPFMPYPDAGGFLDTLGDQLSSPGNKLTYTLNLTQCLASRGIAAVPGLEGYLGVIALTDDEAAHLALAVYSFHFRVVA